MKLEKETILYDYSYCLLDFVYAFSNDERKILKQMHHRKVKLTLEVEKPILDDAERKYLSDVIRPFRDEATIRITKRDSIFENCEQIDIETYYNACGHVTHLPPFKKNTMYKNMKLDKSYELKELGL